MKTEKAKSLCRNSTRQLKVYTKAPKLISMQSHYHYVMAGEQKAHDSVLVLFYDKLWAQRLV